MALMTTRKSRVLYLMLVVLACLSLVAAGWAQSPQPADKDLVHVSPGHVSGNVYSNDDLGFSYEFPAGWQVSDQATQQKTIDAGHQAVHGDDPDAAREHEAAMKCMRILLWANSPAQPKPQDALTPATIVFAFAPSCFPGVKFPTSSNDQAGIKNAVEFLRGAFNDSPLISEGEQKVSAVTMQNHLFLDVSVSTEVEGSDPKTPTRIYASLLLTPVKEYWMVWMLTSNTDSGLGELKKLKVRFAEH